MLTSRQQKRTADEISNSSNVIGKGTSLEGNIETFGNIRIEGKVKGNIRSKSKVALGNGSLVEGDIFAQNADIEGETKGKLEITEMLILKSTAVIHGEIITAKLVVEPGAVFNGSCRMGSTIEDLKLTDNNDVRSFSPQEAKALQ